MLDFYGHSPQTGDVILTIRGTRMVQARVLFQVTDGSLLVEFDAPRKEVRSTGRAYLRTPGRCVIVKSWDGRPIGPE